MRIDDIDWRTGELTVFGKGNTMEALPLPVDVGEAITKYVRTDRPQSPSRAVFLRAKAPYQGLTRQAICQIVYRASDRGGLLRIAAHRLRHSAATAMVRSGASLPEVGQVLRHRWLSTTATYAKVDHVALSELARPWPGGAA